MAREFPTDAESFVDVNIFWGVGEIDREGETKWDSDFIGQIKFSNTFDLSKPTSQKFLKDACDSLRIQPFIVPGAE
jgi:hypothetical protein